MIDLRSDTVTRPTMRMREAIFNASVGDDMYQEDPTMNTLEGLAAGLLGKESALFVTSGIQGNLIAVLSQTSRGDEVILSNDSHMIVSERGNLGSIAGIQTRTLKSDKGQFEIDDLLKTIRTHEDPHEPETGLICLENTHANSGGSTLPVSYLKEIYEIGKDKDIPVHMDGSRIFNAAAGSGTGIKEIARNADTVLFCLSKGLGAPMGSILAGSENIIAKAREWRKALGGATRQAGIVGAAGIVALEEMTERLVTDHENAKIFADGLEQTELKVMNDDVETNIVLVSIRDLNVSMERFLSLLESEGVLAGALDTETVRFVTHYEISEKDIQKALDVIRKVELKISG